MASQDALVGRVLREVAKALSDGYALATTQCQPVQLAIDYLNDAAVKADAIERASLSPEREAGGVVAVGLRGVFSDVLKKHWLTGIECNHEAKTDVATCYCSTWKSEPCQSVGAAVDAWIAHVCEQLPPYDDKPVGPIHFDNPNTVKPQSASPPLSTSAEGPTAAQIAAVSKTCPNRAHHGGCHFPICPADCDGRRPAEGLEPVSETFMLPMDVEGAIAYFDNFASNGFDTQRHWQAVRAYIHRRPPPPTVEGVQGEWRRTVKLQEMGERSVYDVKQAGDRMADALDAARAEPEMITPDDLRFLADAVAAPHSPASESCNKVARRFRATADKIERASLSPAKTEKGDGK
jgi:hypothetical protein